MTIFFFFPRLANTCSQSCVMAIKTMGTTDNVQFLKGTVQKQMIPRYVLFQTKKMLFVDVLVTTMLIARVCANGQHMLVTC